MTNINGKTRTVGLIGNPVEHTLSPFIHNLLAEKMGINTAYLPFQVKTENVKNAVLGAKALGLLGNNVTIPYKTDVLPFVDILDDEAQVVQAVNTLKYKNDQIYGFNTDGYGLRTSCLNNGIIFEGKTICILGAGGAAKSVAFMCAKENIKNLILINRTLETAQELRSNIHKYFDLPIDVFTFDDIDSHTRKNICFQTTSIGMHPLIDACPIEDPAFFNGMEWAVDIIYNPSETKFLKMALSAGVKALNGLEMLFYQAVKSFEIWHEVVIPNQIVGEVLLRLCDFAYNRTIKEMVK
ncbi:MAG: shikimate dehydrogenase [Vallitaleaceae bacterium]|nr:shikimate dehydrogenase [Vallitaleaceae bacterium]